MCQPGCVVLFSIHKYLFMQSSWWSRLYWVDSLCTCYGWCLRPSIVRNSLQMISLTVFMLLKQQKAVGNSVSITVRNLATVVKMWFETLIPCPLECLVLPLKYSCCSSLLLRYLQYNSLGFVPIFSLALLLQLACNHFWSTEQFCQWFEDVIWMYSHIKRTHIGLNECIK